MVETTINSEAGPKAVNSESPELIKTKTAVWEKPTKTTKWIYALPALATMAIAAPISVELKIFYTDTVLVPAGLLALATAIARAFDAITDPIMGWISDRTRTRWGRRKPWIPVGVLGSAFFLWMMFAPPEALTPEQAAMWAGTAFFLYYLFYTILSVPYSGLGLELTPDYDDRTNLFGIRALLGGFGLVVSFSTLYYLKFTNLIPDERTLLSVFVGTLAILMVILYMVPMLRIKENPGFSSRKGAPLIPSIRVAVRNKPFQIILAVMAIGAISSTLPVLLMPYFSKWILVLSPLYRVIFALIYVVATFLSLPVWMILARIIGKLQVYLIVSGIGIVTSFVLFFIGEGQVYLMGSMEFLRGFASGASMVIIPAMVADIVDYDELLTAKRREAQFGSFLAIIPKFVAIFAATVPLAVLGFVGYNPVLPTQPPVTLFAIRALYSLLPIGFYVLIIIIVLKYPITRTVHQAIRKGIDALNRGENAEDPINGKTLVPIKQEDEETTWFLDNFSIKELKSVAENGPEKLKGGILKSIYKAGSISAGSIIGTIYLLKGSVSMSETDQLNQGIGSCLIVVAGLAFTLMIFHILRLRAVDRMTASPTNPEIIKNHIVNLA